MISLQNFRQILPKYNDLDIELYWAPYTKILEGLGTENHWNDWLDTEDILHSRSFRRKEDSLRFVAARILLRCRLSQFVPLAPSCWQLKTHSHGKPFIWGPCLLGKDLPHFNLAHSGEYVALAFSHEFELGVDIEQQHWRKTESILGIASMLFSKKEQEKLQLFLQQNTTRAQQYFFQLWCRYEAYSKLNGTGLMASPVKEQLSYSLPTGGDLGFMEGHFTSSLVYSSSEGSTAEYFWALYWQRK